MYEPHGSTRDTTCAAHSERAGGQIPPRLGRRGKQGEARGNNTLYEAAQAKTTTGTCGCKQARCNQIANQCRSRKLYHLLLLPL